NLFSGAVDRGRFRGEMGELDTASGVRDGPGVLVVRYEAVQVVPAGTPCSLAARVVATEFLGTSVRVRAEVGNRAGVEVRFTVAPSARVAAGDEVHLAFPVEHCHVVPVE